MKQKTFNKKLSLNKATLVNLETETLQIVKGGILTVRLCVATVDNTICFTECNGQACLANTL